MILSRKGRALLFFFVVVHLISTPSLNAAQIYTWTDGSGKVHFSDKKRNDIEQQTVEVKSHKTDWKEFHIDIIDTNGVLSDKDQQMIQRDVKDVYRFFDSKLHFDIYKTVPVKIRIFGQQGDYSAYLADTYNYIDNKTRGTYFSRSNEIVVRMNTKERWRTFWTIKHETSHAIVDTLTPYLPRWLNEGLAENMESIGYSNENFFLYPHLENRRDILTANRKGKLVSIKELLTVKNAGWSKQQAEHTTSQVQAGELVRMLLSTSPGQSFLVRLVHNYERGDRTFSYYFAEKNYLGGTQVLENDFNRWVKNRDKNKLPL